MIPNGTSKSSLMPPVPQADLLVVTLKAVFLICLTECTSKFTPHVPTQERLLITPGPLTSDIYDRVCLGNTMECSCHKRIVIRSVAEYNKLGTAVTFTGATVTSAVSRYQSRQSALTASMLNPVFVEPTFTELHTRSVASSIACGYGVRIRSSSALCHPL